MRDGISVGSDVSPGAPDPGFSSPSDRKSFPLRPAIFLDRDGTIIVERHYLGDPDQVALEAVAAEGLRRIAALGHPLVVVSNQSGVGRGYFPEETVRAVDARVADLLRREGIVVAASYFCPHGPEADCACRKPRPGMLIAAAREHGLDLAQSVMVGDKDSDLEAARAVGATGILVTTGHGRDHVAWARDQGYVVCADLVAASEAIHELLPVGRIRQARRRGIAPR